MNKLLIKKLIKIAGSQKALADVCGVTQQTVNHWLNRDKKIPIVYHIKIERMCAEKGRSDIDRFKLDREFWVDAGYAQCGHLCKRRKL